MEIIPVASDSMGARSFCVFVKTKETKIIIDPGIDLSLDRFNLLPHKKEIDRFLQLKERIKNLLVISDVVIISHYHHDHFCKEFIDLFKGKMVFLKDFRNVNFMQQKRSNEITSVIKEYNLCDGKDFFVKDVRISFSKPLPHGTTNAFVISLLLDDGSMKILYTSDISGPLFDAHTYFILSNKPDILILDGPALYINNSLKKVFIENMNKIKGICDNIILDHHIAREKNFRDTLKEINFMTFASFNNLEEEPLESMRKELWEAC